MFATAMLGADTCRLLVERLQTLRPAVSVEFGSGFSTGLIALYSGQTVSLDNSAKWAAPWPCVRIVALREGRYLTDLPDGVEFALIDGPIARIHGRGNTFRQLWPHLAERFEVWLDDYARAHERRIVAEWQAEFPIDVQSVATEKGLAIITRKGADVCDR